MFLRTNHNTGVKPNGQVLIVGLYDAIGMDVHTN